MVDLYLPRCDFVVAPLRFVFDDHPSRTCYTPLESLWNEEKVMRLREGTSCVRAGSTRKRRRREYSRTLIASLFWTRLAHASSPATEIINERSYSHVCVHQRLDKDVIFPQSSSQKRSPPSVHQSQSPSGPRSCPSTCLPCSRFLHRGELQCHWTTECQPISLRVSLYESRIHHCEIEYMRALNMESDLSGLPPSEASSSAATHLHFKTEKR